MLLLTQRGQTHNLLITSWKRKQMSCRGRLWVILCHLEKERKGTEEQVDDRKERNGEGGGKMQRTCRNGILICSLPSSGPKVIKLFSCSTKLSMKFVLLINIKLLNIAISFLLNIAEHENFSANKYVCVEVLRPSQPNGVMSSAVSLPSHTFTGQA